MGQDTEMALARHKKFVIELVKNEQVWGLTNTKRWATSSSSFLKKAEAMPFWSQEEDAKICAKDSWSTYTATAIPIHEFLENWCAGMYEDHLFVGTNWTVDLEGMEMEPLDLMLEIIQECKAQGKQIELRQFQSLEHLEEVVNEMIESESE